MLLRELVTEIIHECEEYTILKENKSIRIRVRNTGGASSGVTGVSNIPNDTLSVGTISGKASKQIRQRLSRRADTIHFYADDIIDKKLYELVVKDLIATGKYRQIRRVPVGGGAIMWELRRK